MKVTYRDICWFAVVALIFFFLSRCHRDEKGKLNDAVEELKTRFGQDSITYVIERQLLEGKLLAEHEIVKTASIQAAIINTKLEASERAVNRLAAAVRAAKLLPIDTGFVTVAPEYVKYCDSLTSESDALLSDFNEYRNKNTLIIAGKDRQLTIKDSLITIERRYSLGCRTLLSDLEVIYKKAIQTNKPKNQVYIGAEITGTQNTFFQQVGGVFSLKTKKNKLWQISSGIQSNGQLYGRVNGNILISFK